MPYFPNHAIMGRKHQKECPSAQVKDVVCIDQYGKCTIYYKYCILIFLIFFYWFCVMYSGVEYVE